MEVFHDTATECHLPYGITQCYLLPDTSEHTPIGDNELNKWTSIIVKVYNSVRDLSVAVL